MIFNFAPEPLPTEPRPEDVAGAAESGPQRVAGGEVEPARRRALLVGNPNVGKSVLFGALTGTYVTVSNYPGTTVEVTRGRVLVGGAAHGHGHWELLDTPGTNNLVPMSEDEAVTRDILLSEPSDVLVQVGDAKNLTRTLLLTLQLAELGVPFLLDLNMIDEARARGIELDLPGLERELGGVRVNASAAIHGEGVEPVRAYLEERSADASAPGAGREPLPCAARFPEDVELALAEIEAALPPLPVAGRGVATMLLSGDRGFGGWLEANVDAATRRRAGELAEQLAQARKLPPFALLSSVRLARAQAIVRSVQRKVDAQGGARPHAELVPWPRAAAVGAAGAALAALVYDGAVARAAVPGPTDPLDEYGFFDVAARLFSRSVVAGWTTPGLALLAIGAVLAAIVVHRHASARAAVWKLAFAYAVGYGVYWATALAMGLALRSYDARPVHLGALAGLGALAACARWGDGKDAAVSRFLGRYATHPRWGVPILGVVLFFAYKIVGVFGAGTAVDFLENDVFGSVAAQAPLDAPSPAGALAATDAAADGAERLVVLPAEGGGARVVAQVKRGGVYQLDPGARLDLYPGRAPIEIAGTRGEAIVRGDAQGAEARVWTGSLNRWAYRFFLWLGLPLVTAFFVGPYGLLTMGVTYAVAIVLPVVATFFFVFSMLEDSGYLPRLAVMANRQLRVIGLNGKAVLPMVLGLGCDTMATLTARIMETKKERVLVTLLLALGIPCSSQLSVIFAMMQRTSRSATIVWLAVVLLTIGLVGWIAAKVVPGDKSDFLMEMPPIRRPQVRNLVTKTMARIEWYLREAVPLFLAGTALLFFLDFFKLLGWVHRAGEPIVHHLLGFGREGGVSDRVSEALLVGFLRRDFGAAGLLDMARGGRLSTADVAVSMVVITLFIPCVANVFMIVKERGWKVAGLMSAFIFPYAVLVGGLVRLLFSVMGG